MAIGPVGNAIFVNQMTANATAVQNAHNNRIEFQNMMAQVAANEKEQEVLEVRPEENQEVDPNKEHQKNRADQQNQRNKNKSSQQEEDEEEIDFTMYKLDIKV